MTEIDKCDKRLKWYGGGDYEAHYERCNLPKSRHHQFTDHKFKPQKVSLKKRKVIPGQQELRLGE